MTSKRTALLLTAAVPLLLLLARETSTGQTPAPAAPPSPPAAPAGPPGPAPPPNPVSFIRNKIAAGDLASAESILEVHRADNGEDGTWLTGLSWLARGALLLGDLDKAQRYASDARARCAGALAKGAKLGEDHALEIALGAAIEVEAQLRERRGGAKKGAEYLRGELAQLSGPVALRSRLNKRLNMMTLAGAPAPELVLEDSVGEPAPSLRSLRGRPVVLFLWAEWCGDCKAQARALAAARQRHPDAAFVALTRYYEDDEAKRAAEKERVGEIWRTAYADVGTIPIAISTASMERYGGSSTPTFVFVDRGGVVRQYSPTRLTADALEQAVARLGR